ncbi:uncharacterized membrane protein YcaP (DUF421 family) [Paenibacillus phyllosphaerae]|uniref:Uncharacterized membrane protein YcaP (DUF421 family) n=1 Tax=Paenibacillus phyllosphaerae TaxID=274593 RepID=A0A7W5B2V3_9BACL|nr:hypothetical protein [Paenibacillus phyllosphaerae]MBB3113419.1 uncharacterized membrane protein YcaP (DUF421 family) [Paenibacillus phyllosphaerae]
MIPIGTTIVQPIADENLGKAVSSTAFFVGALVLLKILQYRFNWMEGLLSGKVVVVIDNGVLQSKNLRAIRMTISSRNICIRTRLAELSTS